MNKISLYLGILGWLWRSLVMKRLIRLIAMTAFTLPISAGGSAYADFKILGFSDVTYESASNKVTTAGVAAPSETKDGFRLGSFDLVFTGSFNEKSSFLAEANIEFSPETNEPGYDLERVYYKYTVDDAFSVSVGRTHTALGYWNDAYHHGTWFQNSIARPQVYVYEDGGGVLPLHSVGVEFRGKLGFFNYIANVGNGRGFSQDPPTNNHADKNSKQTNLFVYFEPPQVKGLRFGGGILSDKLPASTRYADDGTTIDHLVPKGDETITNAHVVYLTDAMEFIVEHHDVSHKFAEQNLTIKQSYNYVQASHQVAELYTPYLRYEMLNNDPKNTDPYLKGVTGGDKRTIAIVGLRYDLNDATALKLEVAQDQTKNDDAKTKVDNNAVRTNISWHF